MTCASLLVCVRVCVRACVCVCECLITSLVMKCIWTSIPSLGRVCLDQCLSASTHAAISEVTAPETIHAGLEISGTNSRIQAIIYAETHTYTHIYMDIFRCCQEMAICHSILVFYGKLKDTCHYRTSLALLIHETEIKRQLHYDVRLSTSGQPTVERLINV